MAPKNEVVMEERRRLPPQKKWPTLLVRSLSDSAKYRRSAASGRNAHPILLPGGASTTTTDLVGSSTCTASCCGSPVGVTKALTLSLSDSRLFSSQNIHKYVYNCNNNGGCSVAIKTTKFITGNTLGSCFSQSFGGKCSGIPDACENCLEKCEGKDGQEFSEIVDV